MALDESFKRPGSVPFKWEVQPGIPKQQQQQQQDPAAAPPAAATTAPRLAPPPAARVGASCRRASRSVASASELAPRSPPAPARAPHTSTSHRRSMSARFATSLALMPLPFTRRTRGERRGGSAGNGNGKDDADEFCLL